MLRVGFFSDDVGGHIAAVLLAQGLATLGDPVSLATCFPFGRGEPGAGAGTSPVQALALDEGSISGGLQGAMLRGHDIVTSLPLSSIRDTSVAAHLDLRVVVGKEHPAAARALRAARCEPHGAAAAPWFLAFSNSSVIRTQAGLVQPGRIPLPYSTKMLPTALPRLDWAVEERLYGGGFPEECRRTGILLAALATAAAALPGSMRIDAQDMTDLMSTEATSSERRVAERLLALATAFDRVVPNQVTRTARQSGVALDRRASQRGHRTHAAASPASGRPSPGLVRKPF